jgi:hypothetical protein
MAEVCRQTGTWKVDFGLNHKISNKFWLRRAPREREKQKITCRRLGVEGPPSFVKREADLLCHKGSSTRTKAAQICSTLLKLQHTSLMPSTTRHIIFSRRHIIFPTRHLFFLTTQILYSLNPKPRAQKQEGDNLMIIGCPLLVSEYVRRPCLTVITKFLMQYP